jgi:Flp pilus assembly pilin Flp
MDRTLNAHGLKLDAREFFRQVARDEDGQDLIEYALLAGFVSLVAVVAITNVGQGVNGVYGNVDSLVQDIPGGSGGPANDTVAAR